MVMNDIAVAVFIYRKSEPFGYDTLCISYLTVTSYRNIFSSMT